MTKSALQVARASYEPKVPTGLNGNVKIEEGAATESVRDQTEIQQLFPHTYGMPIVKFTQTTGKPGMEKPLNVGVILSGGQAPGGHNVIQNRAQTSDRESGSICRMGQ